MPYERRARSVLAQWRDVERALAQEEPGSPEAERLQAEAMRLRDEYRDLVAAAREAHRPVPPPFPGDH
jgi:hypothetical protein